MDGIVLDRDLLFTNIYSYNKIIIDLTFDMIEKQVNRTIISIVLLIII